MVLRRQLLTFAFVACLVGSAEESCPEKLPEPADETSLLQFHTQASQRQAEVAIGKAGDECWEGCGNACPSYCAGATIQPVYQPQQSKCTPQCTWKCTKPVCDEVCAPVCDAPQCETRCSGFNTKQCRMVCGRPSCAVVCSKSACPSKNCPMCTTKCSEPQCSMQCNAGQQPCKTVCAQPRCKWTCKAPACPKPECSMVCEQPKDCMGDSYRQIPPLQSGECAVQAYDVPASFLQMPAGHNSTMRVEVRVMAADAAMKARVEELPVVSSDAT